MIIYRSIRKHYNNFFNQVKLKVKLKITKVKVQDNNKMLIYLSKVLFIRVQKN